MRKLAELPAWPEAREAALTDGAHFLILTHPVCYQADAEGRLRGVHTVRTVLGPEDDSGRRRPVTVPGSNALLEVDLAIEALGQRPAPGLVELLPGVELNERGFIKIDPLTARTSKEGVYAGGDITGGDFTAVSAVAEGVLAARSIDGSLSSAPAGPVGV